MLIETLVALAVLGAVAWVLVKLVSPRLESRRSGRRLNVVERIAVEPRRSLAIVEVDGRELLIGVADSGITLLRSLEPREPEPDGDRGSSTGEGDA